MSTIRQRPRPLSADFTTHTATTAIQNPKSSMLFTMLPTSIKSRLPRLPSLRRSVSMYGMANRRARSSTTPSSRPSSTGSSTASTTGSRTPEVAAGYTSAMVLRDGDIANFFTEMESEDDIETRRKRERAELEVGDSGSGIAWKFANQGLNLLHLAVNESTSLLRDPLYSNGNASFARQLYIHALTYLLRGLPGDLTTEEQLSLRTALPGGVVEPFQFPNALPLQQTQQHALQQTEPSLLHRFLSSTIVQLFILIQFLLPHLQSWIRAAYAYEREHRISEKVFAQSIDMVDGLGKTGFGLTERVCGMGDGRVGQVIGETARWVVDGVVGGVHEGVGEGMVILGVGRKITAR